MKTGLNTQGYTIIEVMIVLAVTGALLFMVLASISGQTAKTEFAQAMNSTQAQINDVINNVQTNSYPNKGTYDCTYTAGTYAFGADSTGAGTHKDCIIIGRAMQFFQNSSKYSVYNIVGTRQFTDATGKISEVSNLTEAHPYAVSNTDVAGATEDVQLDFGITPATMTYTEGVTADTGSVAFINSLASYDSNSNLASGSQHVDMYPITSTSLASNSGAVITGINSLNKTSVRNPSGGVAICFNSGGSNQSGTITIGGIQGQLSTKLTISPGVCS